MGITRMLEKLVNGWLIAGLLVVWLALNIAFQRLSGPRLASYSNGLYKSLDGKFKYTPTEAYTIIEAYGDEGRRFYMRVELTLDLLFPLTNASLTSLILLSAGKTAPSIGALAGWGVMVAYTGMVADYLENACVLIMLANYPRELFGVARFGTVFTSAKWVLDCAAGAGAIIALLWRGVHALKI